MSIRPWRLLFLLLCALSLAAPVAGGLLLLLLEGLAKGHVSLLLAQPGLWHSLGLSLWVAGASTLGALLFTALLLARGEGRPWMRRLRRLLSPLLALPHVAFAIGVAFLLAPSGWLLRLISPTLTGFDLPPDWQTLRDPWGLGLILALILKETPFLLLMALSALDPVRVSRQQWLGQTMGFSGPQIWWRLLLPALWPALRLPLYAVAAYGMGVVDLALLLGPDAPAPLAVRLWLWYQDPDLQWRGASASGALLLLALNLLLLAALRLLEWSHRALGKARWLDGRRSLPSPWPERLTRAGVWVLLAINLLVLASLLLWSLARRWSFPALWPSEWSGRHWLELLPTLGPLLWQSLWLALLCAGLSLLLAVLALEAQQGRRPHHSQWPLWLICLPLLLPQASLLFGLRLQIDWLGGVDGIGPGWVLWSQLLFVFPYVYLCLHGPYHQFDDRLTRAALSLGASPWRAWWQVKGPLLARPLLFAFGVGAAVSLAQYLPTLLFGAGRVVTITTEAVAIGSGLNRRLAGLYGLLQLLLPLFIYGLVLWLPRRINPALRH
ncbi:ABC transporter permease [Aeromonas sp. 3925]|uniref:ABC transporter permease subunit n=1 Tax=Aeromonas genomosp. paramedia TaxID=3086176 RepID=UPI001FFD42EE|nr:ABC transporter permease subunit [Aeromonas genomosp. paramedia]MCK2084736.1 ABC transporter permease [Aeromonas genomosp. paramedia]